jgi:hypothetical protein
VQQAVLRRQRSFQVRRLHLRQEGTGGLFSSGFHRRRSL